MPKYRKFGNKILDKVTNMASELKCQDTQSGFRAYSKVALNQINFLANGFAVDSEILVYASSKDLKITEVPVTVIYNTNGRTSTKDPISHSTSVLTNLFELIDKKTAQIFRNSRDNINDFRNFLFPCSYCSL